MKRPNPTPGPHDVEILVHVTGPAAAADDRRYRALAESYLAFEPASYTRLVKPTTPDSQRIAPLCFSRTATSHEQDEHTSQCASQSNGLDSPQLSFSGVWANNNSPRLNAAPAVGVLAGGDGPRPHKDSSTPDAAQADSWAPPPSEVADSMPLNHLGILELSSPSRLIHHFMQGPGSSQCDQSQTLPSPWKASHEGPDKSPSDVDVIPATDDSPVPRTTAQQQLLGVSDSSNIVLDTPMAPRHVDVTHDEDEDSETDVIEETVLEEVPVRPIKPLPAAVEGRASSEPIVHTWRGIPPSSSYSGPATLLRSASDTDVSAATSDHPLVLRDNGNGEYLSALEIDAPGPTIGSGDMAPDSLVTANLAALAQSLDVSRRYRPTQTLRELRSYERGYWLLDCSGWDQRLAQRTWGFLHNYISQGLAGWGSRCVRDADWGWMRVWCFGHVIRHIYLLLYLASERKLKTEGAVWIDGEGKVVIITDGHA